MSKFSGCLLVIVFSLVWGGCFGVLAAAYSHLRHGEVKPLSDLDSLGQVLLAGLGLFVALGVLHTADVLGRAAMRSGRWAARLTSGYRSMPPAKSHIPAGKNGNRRLPTAHRVAQVVRMDLKVVILLAGGWLLFHQTTATARSLFPDRIDRWFAVIPQYAGRVASTAIVVLFLARDTLLLAGYWEPRDDQGSADGGLD